MLFPENIGSKLSIDEVSLSKGELYTFATNKKGRSKKGTLVACIKGTRSGDILKVLEKLPLQARKQVDEVTLDMAKNIELAAKAQVEKNLERQRQFAVSQLINSAAATGVSQTSSANSALSSISQDTAIKQGLLEQQTNFANDLTALNKS